MIPAMAWDSTNLNDLSTLPPDYTPLMTFHNRCRAEWAAWFCTRLDNHTGRHAAGDGVVIRAVWP